jgi:hypothetical protein
MWSVTNPESSELADIAGAVRFLCGRANTSTGSAGGIFVDPSRIGLCGIGYGAVLAALATGSGLPSSPPSAASTADFKFACVVCIAGLYGMMKEALQQKQRQQQRLQRRQSIATASFSSAASGRRAMLMMSTARMLILHGDNDSTRHSSFPNVVEFGQALMAASGGHPAEAGVAAGHGSDVELVVIADGGHSFQPHEEWIGVCAAVQGYLAKELGGAVQQLPNKSVQDMLNALPAGRSR